MNMSRRKWIVIGVIGLVGLGLIALGVVFAPRLMSMSDMGRLADMRDGGRGGFRFGGMLLLGVLVRGLLWAVQIGLTALIAAWLVRRWMGAPAAVIAAPSAAPIAS